MTGTARPGGRTARTRQAVADATLAELAERGYAGLTVDRVADRSGVHRTTVYRRWGGVDGLIVDALDLAAADGWQPPDTGSLDGDLRALADEVRHTFAAPVLGPAATAFIRAAGMSEAAAAALRQYFADRHSRSAVIVARAVERGELAGHTDPIAVVRAAVAPLYYRLFVSQEPVDDLAVDQAVSAAVAAARAGSFAG